MSPQAPTRPNASSRESAGNRNDLPDEKLINFYRTMMPIRRFEETALYQSTQGKVYGALHLYIGQEASGVGVCSALEESDFVASTHRGHGHCIAKGARVDLMMAELFGRATGYCRGKGGSMHIADVARGMLGANGIVGAGLGLAAGAALHSRIAGENRVAVAFFGDGAVGRGTFHEVLNLSALWKLPVLFVCENNGYAQWMPTRENLAQTSIARMAGSYAMPGVEVDGNDVRAVYLAAAKAVERARSGQGPTLIETKTQRYFGHSLGDQETYRTKDAVSELRQRTDPIARLAADLTRLHVLGPEIKRDIDKAIEKEIADAVAFAEQSPFPEPSSLLEDAPPPVAQRTA